MASVTATEKQRGGRRLGETATENREEEEDWAKLRQSKTERRKKTMRVTATSQLFKHKMMRRVP